MKSAHALVLLSLLSCGGTVATSTLQVYAGIGTPGAQPGAAGKLTANLLSGTAPALSKDLGSSAQTFGGIVLGLSPIATYRTSVSSLDASGNLLGASDLASIVIPSGAQGLFAAVVRTPSATLGPPVLFSSIAASARTVGSGGAVSVQANVKAGSGPSIALVWSSPGGTFADPSAANTLWTAGGAGTSTLQVSATDATGSTAVVSFPIVVSDALTVSLPEPPANFWPRIQRLVGPVQTSPGSEVSYQVSAFDDDGDPIAYAWSASCGGSFSAAQASQTQFTPVAQGVCLVTIKLDDGRGGTNSQTVTLTVQ